MESFKENQQMLKHWWMLLLPSFVMVFIPLIVSTKKELPIAVVFAPIALVCLIVIIFYFINLQTQVTEKGITIKYVPFMIKPREILWTEVKIAKVKSYDPLFEYGGWGYRKGWRKRKRAYNVYGKTGLELLLADGNMVMIGTQDETKLNQYLVYIKAKYHLQCIE